YNISSQILFKVLDHVEIVDTVVGMFQKEVAERIASSPGTKKYGILSVLIQAYYHVEYLFTISSEVFDPPPKVLSGLIKLTRNEVIRLNCNEKLFRTIVKAGFNHRRKTLRNSLKPLLQPEVDDKHHFFTKRAEELSVQDFIALTNIMDKS
ncbi:MAG TPA: 16S rRNA (adenine(1518)-N(6)/adenine(1519)-N(6))-dimethyltransferase, partial [Flavobacteriales bacterium]|nr:16S rRNA (adenine(1518)-N(6)/adenine(1519)-N(6))-dimethyltransferase [Flavobacteriales bacterium]